MNVSLDSLLAKRIRDKISTHFLLESRNSVYNHICEQVHFLFWVSETVLLL
jgi:hypothetical protein